MRNFIRLAIFSVILLCIGCSNNEPVMTKLENQQSEPTENPELVEENGEENETNEFIDFFLPEERVSINLKMVPILEQYLYAVQDRERAVNNMNLFPIHTENNTLYLLEFSCKNESCSYILIDQSKDNPAYLVADLANFIQFEFSPNMEKIFFKFNRKTDFPISLTHIIIIDLNTWTKLQPHPASSLNFSRPILDVSWVDDENISLVLPLISELTQENIQEWDRLNNPTETIILQLEK